MVELLSLLDTLALTL